MVKQGDTVLVTGGTGMIASHIITQLLEGGYKVHTTVRSKSKKSAGLEWLEGLSASGKPVSIFEAELTSPDGWEEAANGCTGLQHIASPVTSANPKDKTVLIKPAVAGVEHVLNAAAKAGIKRVVMTSSVAACKTPEDRRAQDAVVDESHWTDPEDNMAAAYDASKVLAEKRAFEIAKEHGMALTTICPTLVIGPLFHSQWSATLAVCTKILNRQLPAIPKCEWNLVDTRDVARMHVVAMTTPAAEGKRYLASNDAVLMVELARWLKEEFEPEGRKVSVKELPNALVKIGSLVSADMKYISSRLGKTIRVNTEAAQNDLGIKFGAGKDAFVAQAHDLIKFGYITKNPATLQKSEQNQGQSPATNQE